jgi:hypothetical protein
MVWIALSESSESAFLLACPEDSKHPEPTRPRSDPHRHQEVGASFIISLFKSFIFNERLGRALAEKSN